MAQFVYENPYAVIARTYPDCYVASWSAAGFWDLIDELPRKVILFSKNKTETACLADVDVDVYQVPEQFFFDIEKQETLDGDFMISSPTKSIVDCFAFPDLAGGKRQVDYLFSLYAESAFYQPELLLKYAKVLLKPEDISHLMKLVKEVL